MRRASRAPELLAFDLALCAERTLSIDLEARPSDAPLFTPREPRAPLAGFDEAGRGALAGPVVVGCVAIPPDRLARPDELVEILAEVDDSKALSPAARERALAAVATCAAWAAGCASAREIDRLGIVAAAELAARRAHQRLGVACSLAVFDRGLSLGSPVEQDWRPAPSAARPEARRPRDPAEPPSRPAPSADRPDARQPRDPAELPSCPARRAGQPAVSFTKGDTRSLHVAAASLVAKVTRDRLMESLDRAFPGYGLAQHKGYGTPAHLELVARRGPSPIHRLTFLRAIDGAETQSC